MSFAKFIKVLNEHLDLCTSKGFYVDAEMTRTRINTLRKADAEEKLRVLEEENLQETMELEERQMHQYAELNKKWRVKLEEYYAKSQERMDMLRTKHEGEMEELSARFHAEAYEKAPKWSGALLNMRQIQERLAKSRDFAAAQAAKEKADLQEARERRDQLSNLDGRDGNERKRLEKKQEQEIRAMQMKFERGANEMNNQRERELDQLGKAYAGTKAMIGKRQKKRTYDLTNKLLGPKGVNRIASEMVVSEMDHARDRLDTFPPIPNVNNGSSYDSGRRVYGNKQSPRRRVSSVSQAYPMPPLRKGGPRKGSKPPPGSAATQQEFAAVEEIPAQEGAPAVEDAPASEEGGEAQVEDPADEPVEV